MDCRTTLHIDGSGVSVFQDVSGLSDVLKPVAQRFFIAAVDSTCQSIAESAPDFYHRLCYRSIPLCFCDDIPELVRVTPHTVLIQSDLLDVTAKQKTSRRLFLAGLLEKAFYQWCDPESHASQISHHNLIFLAAHPKICAASLTLWSEYAQRPGAREWLEVLQQVDVILLLERFWLWLAERSEIQLLVQTTQPGRRRELMARMREIFLRNHQVPEEQQTVLHHGRFLCPAPGTLVMVYTLGRSLRKAIRIGPAALRDAMTAPTASFSRVYQTTRTDIFYDHGRFIAPWLERMKLYHQDPTFFKLNLDLLSDNVQAVTMAQDVLVKKYRAQEHPAECLRLLYASLYYWDNPDKGMCRSVALRANKLLEDLLTERPEQFPPSRMSRMVFRGEPAQVTVQIIKPHRVKREDLTVRWQWSLNGRRKRPITLTLEESRSVAPTLYYTGEFPVRKGWIHYATQLSIDDGANWRYESYEPQSQGLIQYVADERGQRVLSFYADTFNLELNEDHQPVRDEQGAYVYGSFDTLAEQLEGICAEGYTRLYPLGALELGRPGEAGPDPSVFSIWDGHSIRRDMGGLPALLRLRDAAERLGMKIILCVVSHLARACYDYPYHLPVYIVDAGGNLSRRAGWDGEWDEWLDSFMVNMRDFRSVEYLALLAEELTTQGFGLRIDVGHGFDTVFPSYTHAEAPARLLGEVCTPGFEPVDLRGTSQANIALLYMSYRAQKKAASTPIIYAEQWHGNETRMLQSGATPYNSLIKNLEHMRAGATVSDEMGLNENLRYLHGILDRVGGQTLSLFNSHDEESPTSNYQNMIWPVAAFLVFSSYGPLVYHISRLPGRAVGSLRDRFDLAYLECWKHWVNNRFSHPWEGEEQARQQLIAQYPMLKGFGTYLRSLYEFAAENPVLSKGTVIPLATYDGRIAAFVRTYQDQMVVCVFNFPDSHHGQQQALPREFTFALKYSDTQRPLEFIAADAFYEIKERYNNVEGRRRRGQREVWSGEELLHLGFGGVLEPVSSHVFEISTRGEEVDEANLLPDSFARYFRYGKRDRVRHTYVARVFTQASLCEQGGFKRFFPLFVTVVQWIQKSRKMGLADLSILLAEISEGDKAHRRRLVEFLMRVAVHRQKGLGNSICEAAADILHSLEIGTIVMVSPESRFSGSSGGVGLYTTDIADVLSEMGFHVVIVTPLYQQNREQIIQQFKPQYEGHRCAVRFPTFDEAHQRIGQEASDDVVNFLRCKLNRFTHGKRSRVEVIYLENAKYFDQPYSGDTAEDKLRRARLFAQGAIEALRSFNYYPAIIQTNEWPTWLVAAYLTSNRDYRYDSHFARTQTFSMMHNPHPAYSIVLEEANPRKASYYARVLDFDPVGDFDTVFAPATDLHYTIDLTHIMLKTSATIGTVSNAMRQRILDEPWLFGHADLFQRKAADDRFFSRRNGFNMAARQRFWFGSKKSLLETCNPIARRRLFLRYTQAKENAKRLLQADVHIHLDPDTESKRHVIFGMLHRVCPQKGFELLVDWKVRSVEGTREVYHDPNDMGGRTVLEAFLASHPLVQFVICGRVEDSFDARRFHMHLERIAHHPDFQGRFAYHPEGSLSPSLYRNLYVGCQYFVMPSGGAVGEPCGISQQEAHAGGTPVIAHHQDGLKTTVTDVDFGDTGQSANGIKFSGFHGKALLAALEDAVSVYGTGRRLLYRDRQGQPVALAYADLSYNAFCTDHRWLHLLRDYVRMYAFILEVDLPQHLDAIQLSVDIDINDDKERYPGDAVLRRGVSLPEAWEFLQRALNSPVASVRHSVAQALKCLAASGNGKGDVIPASGSSGR